MVGTNPTERPAARSRSSAARISSIVVTVSTGPVYSTSGSPGPTGPSRPASRRASATMAS